MGDYRRMSAASANSAPSTSLGTLMVPTGVEQPADEPRYLLRSEHPQVALTWSTAFISNRPRPDVLKLRKRVHAWPLEFTLKADYHTATREFSYGLSCRDQLLRGDVTLDVPQRQVEYRKRLPLAGGALLALNASCRLEGQRLRPDASLTLEFGTHTDAASAGAAVYVADPSGQSSFDVQQRFCVAKGLALEVCGNVRLPSPAARYSPQSGQLVLGDGAFQLHVAQVNAVVHV